MDKLNELKITSGNWTTVRSSKNPPDGTGHYKRSVLNEDHYYGKLVAFGFGKTDEEALANATIIAAAPRMLQACKNSLADLEGIMPEFEPGGDRSHPAWKTIDELKKIIEAATKLLNQ